MHRGNKLIEESSYSDDKKRDHVQHRDAILCSMDDEAIMAIVLDIDRLENGMLSKGCSSTLNENDIPQGVQNAQNSSVPTRLSSLDAYAPSCGLLLHPKRHASDVLKTSGNRSTRGWSTSRPSPMAR